MDQFAKCLVTTQKRPVDRLLTMPAIGPESNAWSKGADLSNCLKPADYGEVRLRFRTVLLRGAVFKTLYAREFAERDLATTITAAAPPMPLPDWFADLANAQGIEPAATQNYVALRALGACVVQAKPEPVHRLLRAEAGSDQENAAIVDVTPAISGCLPNGETLRFSKQVLIGVIAETAYRMAQMRTP